MSYNGFDFRKTWLWRQAFEKPRSDAFVDEQEFFRTQYLSMREKVEHLVSKIQTDSPELTIHDISHLDALWETASMISEGAMSVNPAEAFVFGASVLLHDSALSLAGYPNGLSEIREKTAWKDAIARLAAMTTEANVKEDIDIENPPPSVEAKILPDVLRRLHADHAETLAEQAWEVDGQQVFLMDDLELRRFYGPTIGLIARSHWWSLSKVEIELSGGLGALSSRTRSLIDRIKLACLLRIADALHLDGRRAPTFLKAITRPTGIAKFHWDFQGRLATPHVELDAIVFTAGQPFSKDDAEAWWLAYDILNAVDRELRDVDFLLQNRGKEVLRARRVKGIASPEAFAETVKIKGWRPIEAKLIVSDVPRIVENLGGEKLYGDSPIVALRELLQNSADAVQARRRYQKRSHTWGEIIVSLIKRDAEFCLVVEDNGIGMSEAVLTGPLLDFGTSFWRSPMAMEEFPGLIASGMQAIGRFGIGFFSVFMLGSEVRVYSRRCDKGQESGRVLDFKGGIVCRPILFPCGGDPVPVDGGTRIEVLLKKNPFEENGLLYSRSSRTSPMSLSSLIASIAPSLDVAITAIESDQSEVAVSPGDWLELSQDCLMKRLDPQFHDNSPSKASLMQILKGDDGITYGRAFIDTYNFWNSKGWVTIAGLRACQLYNIQGILEGEVLTAVRDIAKPLVPDHVLAGWASKQAELISSYVLDEEEQACSAEVVLVCGGCIGELKILHWGEEWFNSAEFKEKIRAMDELYIEFGGDFDYDEDLDEAHPREFRDHFEIDEDIIIVPRHDGRIISSNGFEWPSVSKSNHKNPPSNLAMLVENLINETWGGFEVDEERRLVGHVIETPIYRDISKFYRELDSEEL